MTWILIGWYHNKIWVNDFSRLQSILLGRRRRRRLLLVFLCYSSYRHQFSKWINVCNRFILIGDFCFLFHIFRGCIERISQEKPRGDRERCDYETLLLCNMLSSHGNWNRFRFFVEKHLTRSFNETNGKYEYMIFRKHINYVLCDDVSSFDT